MANFFWFGVLFFDSSSGLLPMMKLLVGVGVGVGVVWMLGILFFVCVFLFFCVCVFLVFFSEGDFLVRNKKRTKNKKDNLSPFYF